MKKTLFFVLLFFFAGGLAWIALMVPLLTPLSAQAVEVGRVAQQDLLAPRPVTYESEVLTRQQAEAAARAVSPNYSVPDTAVARRQLEELRAALAYVSSVRADAYASPEQKLADLAALEHIRLGQDPAEDLLALSDPRWQAVQQEAIVVLEQVMRTTIREDRLDDVRRSVPALVSLSLPEEQARMVVELVSSFVAPNSFYREDLTETAREKARQAVLPVSQTFATGQTVVRRGQVITERDLEALQKLGLTQSEVSWKEMASAAGIVLLSIFFVSLYLRRKSAQAKDVRALALMTVLFLVFLTGARLLIPGHTVIPYLYPIAAYSLAVAVLFGAELALITSLPLAILAAWGLPNALDLTLYYALGSLFGVLALGSARRVMSFFWAGLTTAGCGAVVILAYRLTQPATDWIGLATLVGASLFNGLGSASLGLLQQFFLAQFLGRTTPLQLMEISRPDHPLLQLILRNSPGTYQHSLQVANLAEQAAERIGADPLLTRVGALYHDVGKAAEPVFFIENQMPGSANPHDELDPQASAYMILRHVANGLELARKYRLPGRIQDFIAEHHGTMMTHYQYAKAVDAANGERDRIDPDQFRYPGPRPRSKETAILMLADSSEAVVRADHPKDEDELRKLIKSVVDSRVQSGQLDKTDLTLRDLEAIVDSFTATLKGIYHPRIQYPKLEGVPPAETEAEELPAQKTIPLPRPPELPLPVQTESRQINS
jgi:putative nucleotidyltransferase with HDIG domain